MKTNLKLQDLVEATSTTILKKVSEEFVGVATDGRVNNEGKLFFALKGPNYDAHKFLEQVINSGVGGIVVHEDPPFDVRKSKVTIIKVKDTLVALQKLAHHWRKKMPAKMVAITGSNGKTTTKGFAAILCAEKYETQYAKGSYNNHWGLPLSILTLDYEHEVGIFELGMNHAGELTELTKILDPDVSIVTTVGRAHLQSFENIEAVARAKEELYLNSRPGCLKIYNLDNPLTKAMKDRAPKNGPSLTFSAFDSKADVHLKEVVSKLDFMEVSGKIAGEPGHVKVPIFGRQNITNLMAAACIAKACGVESEMIWAALPKCKTTWGRNQIIKLASGAKVIFDGYNANPDSMGALIDNVSRLNIPGKKVAVLGEMLEMGEQSDELHDELGRRVAEGNFDIIWFIGSKGASFERGIKSGNYSKKLFISNTYEEGVATKLLSMLEANDIVLVKGSRGMKLEKVIQSWSPQNFSKD